MGECVYKTEIRFGFLKSSYTDKIKKAEGGYFFLSWEKK